MTKKVIILGSRGMLGQELVQVFLSDPQYITRAWDKEEMDASNTEALAQRLEEEKPDYVINAIAYNAVDKCEQNEAEYTLALRLNRDLPQSLAVLSTQLDFTLVHYSTDYVFSGEVHDCANIEEEGKEHGYREDAKPSPVSRYGESKLLGEQAVQREAKKYYIIRLAKLFGKPATSSGAKRSFFDVMLEAGKSKPEVQVVHSERGSFTYAPDLAKVSKGLLESEKEYGIYHLPNAGSATWYEAVLELYRLTGITTTVVPVSPDTFPRPAKRPPCSMLINTKFVPLRHFRDALEDYFTEVK